jgi:UDP-glucuronate 4-epimerase
MTCLVTGAAGFIGYHLSQRLLAEGHQVVGLDNLNAYYDPALKQARLAQLEGQPNFQFRRAALEDQVALEQLFDQHNFSHVVHLGAQAGVRYSLDNPRAYIDANISGTLNILECCRHSQDLKHLIYASSSSVYGMNTKQPFTTDDAVDHPVSLYAATKKSNELMAHTYSHLYGIPATGLRFFTVYGPWGRPDMAYWLFTQAILENRPIKVFNNGEMQRDFTYIDDIVEGIVRLLDHLPEPETEPESQRPSRSWAPHRIYNIGNNQPVTLGDFIATIENALGKKAIREMHPMQPGDVLATWADIDDLQAAIGYRPSTPLAEGIGKFVDWYRRFYPQT